MWTNQSAPVSAQKYTVFVMTHATWPLTYITITVTWSTHDFVLCTSFCTCAVHHFLCGNLYMTHLIFISMELKTMSKFFTLRCEKQVNYEFPGSLHTGHQDALSYHIWQSFLKCAHWGVKNHWSVNFSVVLLSGHHDWSSYQILFQLAQ